MFLLSNFCGIAHVLLGETFYDIFQKMWFISIESKRALKVFCEWKTILRKPTIDFQKMICENGTENFRKIGIAEMLFCWGNKRFAGMFGFKSVISIFYW